MSPDGARTTSPFTRRRLLKLTGLGALALAGGSAVFMGGSSAHYRRLLGGVSPKTLSPKEMAVLLAVVARILPDAPGRLSAKEARIAERIDRELAFHPKRFQDDFRAALLLVEHGGWLHFSPRRFSRLSPPEQEAHLARMSQGSALERQAFNALRMVSCFFYYCDERTWKDIGYQGPLVSVRSPPEADSNPFRIEG